MLIPQNKTQTVLMWLLALLGAITLAFLSSLAQQLPGSEPINWRTIALDVINVIISSAPFVAAGLGLPRLGAENRARLINEIGADRAVDVLEQEAQTQADNAQGLNTTYNVDSVDYGKLADSILERRERAIHATNK